MDSNIETPIMTPEQKAFIENLKELNEDFLENEIENADLYYTTQLMYRIYDNRRMFIKLRVKKDAAFISKVLELLVWYIEPDDATEKYTRDAKPFEMFGRAILEWFQSYKKAGLPIREIDRYRNWLMCIFFRLRESDDIEL